MAENHLTLVTALPLVAPVKEEPRGENLIAHSLTALLLAEHNFGAQLLESSIASSANARLLVARRERMELGMQMAFAAAANGDDATGSPFTVLLNCSGPPSCTPTRVHKGGDPGGPVISRETRDAIDGRRRDCGNSSRQRSHGGKLSVIPRGKPTMT